MNKKYVVKEYSVIGGEKDKDCCIMVYDSKEKAEKDFMKRIKGIRFILKNNEELISYREYSKDYITYYKLEII